MRKFIPIVAIFFLTACGPREAYFKTDVPITPIAERVLQNEKTEQMVLPEQVNLDVTFFPQAPDGNWGDPWQEACEEASITQVFYYKKNLPLSKDVFRQKILDLVEWQTDNFGYWQDTNIKDVAKMLRGFYGYQGELEIVENPTVRDIKEAVAMGNPVVVPFAGRMLGNPFFSGAGPWYHMAVIKGYDTKNFILNDVGTRRGHNFIYSYETVMYAMHDWNGSKENIQNGAKRILIVK